MRFLSEDEAWALIANKPFERGHNAVLPLWVEGQHRVDCGPVRAVELLDFAHDLVRWLPRDADRLFWLTDWRGVLSPPHRAYGAMRAGLGGSADMSETPACHFATQPWTEDVMLELPEDRSEREALVGMLVLTLVSDWDGWLFSTATDDAVEIWETNVFFVSARPERLAAAEGIVARYGAPKLV